MSSTQPASPLTPQSPATHNWRKTASRVASVALLVSAVAFPIIFGPAILGIGLGLLCGFNGGLLAGASFLPTKPPIAIKCDSIRRKETTSPTTSSENALTFGSSARTSPIGTSPMSKTERSKKEIYLALLPQTSPPPVKPDASTHQLTAEYFEKIRNRILAQVAKDGLALRHLVFANDELKKDKKIVLAAVRQNGLAIQYADDELKKDPDVVLAAIKQNILAYLYVDNSLLDLNRIDILAILKRKKLESKCPVDLLPISSILQHAADKQADIRMTRLARHAIPTAQKKTSSASPQHPSKSAFQTAFYEYVKKMYKI